MLRKDAKLELIRSVPLFAHCTKKELTAVASVADIVDVPAGQQLVSEGDALAREFMVIVDGAADVRRRGRRIATLGSASAIQSYWGGVRSSFEFRACSQVIVLPV